MKDFSLGLDHTTGQPLRSEIKGYQSILDLRFAESRGRRSAPSWVRYWIVPKSVARHVSRLGELILVEVPLEVRTQAMVLRGGKLVPAPRDRAPTDAAAFARWFTEHYDDLAREIRVLPPRESRHAQPVAVLEELQRIATITA